MNNKRRTLNHHRRRPFIIIKSATVLIIMILTSTHTNTLNYESQSRVYCQSGGQTILGCSTRCLLWHSNVFFQDRISCQYSPSLISTSFHPSIQLLKIENLSFNNQITYDAFWLYFVHKMLLLCTTLDSCKEKQ